jgi:hypothetical protein
MRIRSVQESSGRQLLHKGVVRFRPEPGLHERQHGGDVLREERLEVQDEPRKRAASPRTGARTRDA